MLCNSMSLQSATRVVLLLVAGADTGFSEGGGGDAHKGGGGVIGGDRPCRRKITI